jgi:hypothetical protein
MIKKIKLKLYALVFWQTHMGDLLNKLYDIQVFFKNSFTEHELKSKENRQAFLNEAIPCNRKRTCLTKT